MKIDFSIEISKKCITDTLCCRKSSKIVPYTDHIYDIASYRPRIRTYHKGEGGTCVLCCLFTTVISCVVAPVFGLLIGPILYWIKVADGTYPITQPTLMPTISPINNSYVITL